jgi:hypothetical protein
MYKMQRGKLWIVANMRSHPYSMEGNLVEDEGNKIHQMRSGRLNEKTH